MLKRNILYFDISLDEENYKFYIGIEFFYKFFIKQEERFEFLWEINNLFMFFVSDEFVI